MTLLDASPDLLALAARRCPTSPAWLEDLCTFATEQRFDAVTCRGVLNDLLSDGERDAALTAMAACLAPSGMLLCDVREAGAARDRADGSPRRRAVALPGGGTLTFTSTSRWEAGLLQVREEHLVHPAVPGARGGRAEHSFAMRPWTVEELHERLRTAGLQEVEVGPGVGRRTPDRLFVTAVRPRTG